MNMKPKTISFSRLSNLAGVTVRRLHQLGAEQILPEPIKPGELPFDEAITALFRYFRGSHGEVAAEKLKLLRAQRKLTEQKYDKTVGGELISTALAEKAITQAQYRLEQFITSDYYAATGLSIDPHLEQRWRRAIGEAVENARTYIQQTLEADHEQAARESGTKKTNESEG
jgi:hypothetical protein